MTLQVIDRIKETTATIGTGTWTLAGAVTGFQAFSTVGNGNTVYYAAYDGASAWEVGLGTYASAGNTLARTTVLKSSNSNNAVNFATGPTIWGDYPADRAVTTDNAVTLTNKSISGATNTLTAIPNSALTNSSVTYGTTTVALGASSTSIAGLTSVGITTGNVLNWNSDTGISREAAGILDFGNGTQGDKSATLKATALTLTGNLTTALTANSVPYVGAAGLLSQDTTNLLWDATNHHAHIGSAITGDWNEVASGYAFWQNQAVAIGAGNYALLQAADGSTFVNTVTGKKLVFGCNNVAQFTIDTAGVITTSALPMQFNSFFNVAAGFAMSWNADTGMSRDSAGVVDFGNGTQGDKTGTIKLTSVQPTQVAVTQAAISTTGLGLVGGAITITDNSTALNGTVTNTYEHVLGAPTFAASNTGITYTNAASLFVAKPVAGTNVTITNNSSILTAGNITVGAKTGANSIVEIASDTDASPGEIRLWSNGAVRVELFTTSNNANLNAFNGGAVNLQVSSATVAAASTGLLAVTGAVTATKQLRSTTSTALGNTGTLSLDPTLGRVFTSTPSGAITVNAASAAVGSLVTLIVTTSGVSSFNITFGTSFKSQGVLATGTSSGKVFTVSFIGDGTNLNEMSRTTAM